MVKMGKVALVAAVAGIMFSGNGYAGSWIPFSSEEAKQKGEPVSMAGKKEPFAFKKGDTVLTLGGKSVTEYRFAKNAVLLNSNIPDEFGHFRQTVDGKFNFAYGEEKYGHKAVEIDGTARFKTVWGKIGYMASTERDGDIKVGNVALSPHSHASSRSLIWMKDAWIKASLNAITNIESDKLQFVKLGMFPFSLGRGIALGTFYGISKDFLAIYSRFTDYSAPGILFTGEICKDLLSYDLYYAKLEEKSASFGDVFNSNKEKVIGRRTTPWSGAAKDSDLVAARVTIKPVDNDTFGKLDLEPYIFYNEASDQKVELAADSKSMLGTVGFAAEYKKKNFELGGEIACNYGHEKLYAIDRNRIELAMIKYNSEPVDSVESLREVYSKIVYADGHTNAGQKVPVTAATESDVVNSTDYTNGAVLTSNADYRSADNRFRPAYKNKYRGWMAVVDASYLFDSIDLTAAAAYGYASGDKNPHGEECDKTYNGFVGLHELYCGKRVSSIFMLDARKIKRPLTLVETTGETNSDPSFTDIQYVGIGATWAPKRLKENNFSVNPNLLFFWKAHESRKYDSVNNKVSDCENARKFLGTEINLKAQYDLLKDLSLIGGFAFFFPGSYYDDIKGTPMKGDLFNRLELTDLADLPSTQYRISDDTAFYAQIALEYRF